MAGRQEGDRLAGGAGPGSPALAGAVTEPALRRLALGLALSIAAIASAEAQPVLRIGASLSQTGPFAPLALNQLRGYQLCVEHVNDKGGLLGWRVELVVEDGGSEPAVAARRGLKTVAVVYEDTAFPKAIAHGTVDLARRRGLQITHVEGYPKGTTDFTAVLRRVAGGSPDLLVAATYYEDAVAIPPRMRAVPRRPPLPHAALEPALR